ncbi:uncharacterized protein LOC135502008 isoform X2 [Lineus longissimus]
MASAKGVDGPYWAYSHESPGRSDHDKTDDSGDFKVTTATTTADTDTMRLEPSANGSRESFTKHMETLWFTAGDCDVTLVTNTTTVKVHKAVLSKNSEYFETMFSTTCLETSHNVVSFEDDPYVTSTALDAILDRMYERPLQLLKSNVGDIYEAAQHFVMPGVIEECEQYIDRFPIRKDNCAWLYETAQKFGRLMVIRRIEVYFRNIVVDLNDVDVLILLDLAVAISNSDGVITKFLASIARELPNLTSSQKLLQAMTAEMLLDMLEADRHGMFTDITLIEFIVKWVDTNPKDRLPALSGLITKINFLCFDMDSLNEITTMPFIKEDKIAKMEIGRAVIRLTAIGQNSIDDTYFVAMHDEDMKFYCTTKQSIVTIPDIFVLPSRKQRKDEVYLNCLSLVSVGAVLFILGRPDRNGESPCYSYNPSRNIWRELASLRGSRENYKMVCQDGEVYALGGKENGETTDRVDIYNFGEDEWKEGPALPCPISSPEAAVLHGSIYVRCPGDHDKGIATVIDEFNCSRKWKSKEFRVDFIGKIDSFDYFRRKKKLNFLSSMDRLYYIYSIPAGKVLVMSYDLNSEHLKKFTTRTSFNGLSIEYAMSHMGTIYLVASYIKGGRIVSSLFRLDELARDIELLVYDIVIPRGACAMISVPIKIKMDCSDANYNITDISRRGDESGDFGGSGATGITCVDTEPCQTAERESKDNFSKQVRDKRLLSADTETGISNMKTIAKAHDNEILAAISEYFNTIYSRPCSDASDGIVSFANNPNVPFAGLDDILDYPGSYQPKQSNVAETLEAARHFHMTEIAETCENFLNELPVTTDNCVWLYETAQRFGIETRTLKLFLQAFDANMVNPENYLPILGIAIANNLDGLVTKVITFIARELSSLSSQELLEIMTEEMLLEMLGENRHGLFTDMTLVEFIVQWVGKSPENRLPMLRKLMKKVNLLYFDVDSLGAIANMPFIREDKRVKKAISRAVEYLSVVQQHRLDDYIFLATMPDSDIVFYCTTDHKVTKTMSDILVIPSRKRETREVNLSCSSVLSLGDTLFILGRPNKDGESSCYSYNPSHDVWKELASLKGTRDRYAMVCLGSDVYVIGGFKRRKITRRVDIYHMSKDEWEEASPLPCYLRSFRAAVLQSKIYVYALYKKNRDLETVFIEYDLDNARWELRKLDGNLCSDLGVIGHILPGVTVLYHIYKFPHGSLLAERYDPMSEQWTKLVIRQGFSDFRIESGLTHMGRIYLVASYTKSEAPGRKVYSLFWFNEATSEITLLLEYLRIGSGVGAMVQVPRVKWLNLPCSNADIHDMM